MAKPLHVGAESADFREKWAEHRDWEAMTKLLHLINLKLIINWPLLWAADASTNPQLESLKEENPRDKAAQLQSSPCSLQAAPVPLAGLLWADMSPLGQEQEG